MAWCAACERDTTSHDLIRHGLDANPVCRRCRVRLNAAGARYIRMRVVAKQYVRESTPIPTDAGPFCLACLPLELDPA